MAGKSLQFRKRFPNYNSDNAMAVIAVISGITKQRGERVNSALY